MNEKELLEKLEATTRRLEHAQKKVSKIKRELAEAETQAINAKIEKERLEEQLRVLQASIPKHELTFNQQEAQAFREKFPELCAWAEKRDKKQS